jgi:hypothetical protein
MLLGKRLIGRAAVKQGVKFGDLAVYGVACFYDPAKILDEVKIIATVPGDRANI